MASDVFSVLFAVAEAHPYAKVGGLADVGSALPKALARRGHDVRLVLPGYRWLTGGAELASYEIPFGGEIERIGLIDHGLDDGVDVWTLSNERYFARDRVYGYDDDIARFILFSKAVVHVAADVTPDVVHGNDWHAGLVPEYARRGECAPLLEESAMALTIHNLAYQGPLDENTRPLVCLDQNGLDSLLARGIAFADAINTVSDHYRQEIVRDGGMGLDHLLRGRGQALRGILNGIRYEDFDPATDPHIPAPFDSSSLERKRTNRVELQRRSGLAADPAVPVVGMVARIVEQKGIDVLVGAIPQVVALGAQVVVMGLGEPRYEAALAREAAAHGGSVAYHRTDEEALARLLYAGSDFFLAPSSFEPCGLGPLIALRYGSIPIVRRTGGLAETIVDCLVDPDRGLGFTFVRKYPRDLVRTVASALEVYRSRASWTELQLRAMAADFSWERSVRDYEAMYRDAVRERRRSALPALIGSASV
jgi:starch synthase